VARHLSFVRAREELDVTTTAISKTIKQLEAQLACACSTARPAVSRSPRPGRSCSARSRPHWLRFAIRYSKREISPSAPMACCASTPATSPYAALIEIFDEFLPPNQPFHLYYANRTHMPSKLRAFIEVMQAANWKVPK
jgi:DNA-binding transcriptional LysR family regulator